MQLGVVVCCFLVCIAVSDAAWRAPKWPASYQVSLNITVPYINKLQSTPLEYQYTFWRDATNGRQKMARDGTETKIMDLTSNKQYDVFPAKDHYICWVGEIAGTTGPTRQGEQAPAMQLPSQARRKLLEHTKQDAEPEEEDDFPQADMQKDPPSKFGPEDIKKLGFVLPDLTEARWKRNGTEMRGSQRLARYTYQLKEDYGYGIVEGQYNMLVDLDGAPVELLMWGINLYTGGHFDDYRAYFYDYKPGPIDDNEFKIPNDICKDDNTVYYAEDEAHKKPQSAMEHVIKTMPNPHYGDPEYDVFVHRAGRRHASAHEYQQRKQVYYNNKQTIEEHNAGNHSYQLGMNQWGDWTQEERRTLFRNKSERRAMFGDSSGGGKSYKHMVPHEPVVPLHQLPAIVDWRDTLADSPVKDQAACGSCWAFSTIASMEGAYYRATGKQLLLSEQHLLDCAWNAPQQHGCFGGDQDMAMEWIFDHGHLATEESYPYVGVFNWCKKKDEWEGPKFTGTWRLVGKGQEAVMEAILTKGVMTTSIDASADDMTFYKSGVYFNPKCATEEAALDHAVMLSGYGETEDGHKYWLVKNTWSTYWGEGGYVRVDRSTDDCGLSTQVMYAEIEVTKDVE